MDIPFLVFSPSQRRRQPISRRRVRVRRSVRIRSGCTKRRYSGDGNESALQSTAKCPHSNLLVSIPRLPRHISPPPLVDFPLGLSPQQWGFCRSASTRKVPIWFALDKLEQ